VIGVISAVGALVRSPRAFSTASCMALDAGGRHILDTHSRTLGIISEKRMCACRQSHILDKQEETKVFG